MAGKRRAALLALLVALLPACGADDESRKYSAELQPLSGSGVSGAAAFEVRGDEINVRMAARGLEAGQIVPTYIRGFVGVREARCPESGEELSAREARAYGDTLFSVEPFPTIKPGEATLLYDLTLSPSEAERRRLEPLERRVLVLEAGERDASPVACGEITRSQ